MLDERGEVPDEVNVDDWIDEELGVRYIGYAYKQPNGKWHCLADVHGQLALVEVNIRWAEEESA